MDSKFLPPALLIGAEEDDRPAVVLAAAAMIVALLSPDGAHDSLYLGNYAQVMLKDELTRLPGVAGVTLVGAGNYGLRIWLDPDKLAAHRLTVTEVLTALRELNLPVRKPQAGGRKEGESTITIQGGDRSVDVETLADIVLKASEGGPVLRLKDVARIELGAEGRHSRASLDGKPAVILAIHSRGTVTPRKLRAAVRDRVAELRSWLPRGLDLTIPFDFTSQSEVPARAADAAYLLVDLDLPPGASAERQAAMLERAQALLQLENKVQHTLALSEDPFDLFGGGPCILAALAPEAAKARGKMVEAIRTRLDEIREITVRVRELSASGALPRFAYPIDLAAYGLESGPVRDFAKKLAERLDRSGKLRDVWINPNCLPQPQVRVELDREKVARQGISLRDVALTLQAGFGPYYVNDFTRFGRTWQITVQTSRSGKEARELLRLKVRNARGEMVPVAMFATVRESDAPLRLDRLDISSMLENTAHPAPGVSLEEARKACRQLAEEVRKELGLPASYRSRWLE
jgi:multidrug efflux pump subunit AcrB